MGSLLAGQLFGAFNDETAKTFPVDDYKLAVERLTADGWRRQFAEDEDES